jgi:hypothetical protein
MARQFDACPNPETRSNARIPHVVLLQADRFDDTKGVVVAPLVNARIIDARDRLYPVSLVADAEVAMVTTDIAAVPRSLLRTPVANLARERHRIAAALDLLFTGI